MRTEPARPSQEETTACHNARWYFSGLAASLLGNSAMSLVAGIWVKQLTGSSADAGLVSACVYAPTMAAPLAGLLADRLPRTLWLLGVNVVSAITILPLLLVHSRATAWIIFVVMAIYGIEATLSDPAEDALFAELFTPDFRRRITGWRLAIQETGRLAAPLLGAALFTALGGGAVAGLDCATFIFAAFVVTRLRADRHAGALSQAPGQLGEALTAGIRHLARTPQARGIALAAGAVMALSGVGVAAQYSLVHAVGQRPAFLAVFSALLGAGSIVAALSAGRLIKRFGERTLALLGLLNFAVGDGLRSVAWLPSALLGSVVLGFALPFVFLAVLNISQRLTPTALQGRVSAALVLGLFGPQAPMQALGSLLIAHLSYSAIYAGSALLSLIIAVALGLADRLSPSDGPPPAASGGGLPDEPVRIDAGAGVAVNHDAV